MLVRALNVKDSACAATAVAHSSAKDAMYRFMELPPLMMSGDRELYAERFQNATSQEPDKRIHRRFTARDTSSVSP
jgi:hypothetical protein